MSIISQYGGVMRNLTVNLFAFASLFLSLSAQESVEIPYVSHNIMLKDELNSLVNDIDDSLKSSTSIQKLWKRYLIKIRGDARKNHKRVKGFIKNGQFYITLKRTTFLKEFGGFEHTPICIILPIQKKNVMIGQQICTTPSFNRLFPVSKFTVELSKELENIDFDIDSEQKYLTELNAKHTVFVDLIAKIVATIAWYNNLNDYDREQCKYKDRYKRYDEERLNELIRLYKQQIRELNAFIRKVECSIVHLRKREKNLRMSHDFIIEQMKYYQIPIPQKSGNDNIAPDSSLVKLRELKQMLNEGLIDQSDYDSAKKKILNAL